MKRSPGRRVIRTCESRDTQQLNEHYLTAGSRPIKMIYARRLHYATLPSLHLIKSVGPARCIIHSTRVSRKLHRLAYRISGIDARI